MLRYDSQLDQYTEVSNDEFSESTEDETENLRRPTDPILILTKRRRSKSRSILRHFYNLARIVRKSGRLNTLLTQLPNKNINYMRDLGNTLLTIQWRWIILTLILVNFACFLIFGMLWYIVALNSGDFETNQTDICVINTRTITGYILLSVETIMTIGYGYRYPTEHCSGGWLMLTLQALFNIAIQGALVSVVYVKISKPFTYQTSSIFSKTAVISLRDGRLHFIFRIHDFTKKIWCGTNISLYFICKEQIYPNTEFEITQMKIEPHGLLLFPLEIEHVIDASSPLWTFRPLDILHSRFEIIAVAEGSSNITGQVSQNRTSYSNSDIYWGHRFLPCVDYDEKKNAYIVDYRAFKKTIPFDTPLCSAKKMNDIRRQLECSGITITGK